MRPRYLVPLLCVSLLAGCKKGLSRLEGHWRGTRIEGTSADQTAAASALATQFELTVKGDSLTITSPKGGTGTGHVSVVRETKDSLVVKSDLDGPSEETFTFPDDHSVIWKADSKLSVTFTKDTSP